MRYVIWILKFLLFVLVLTFAVVNTETVTVRYFLGWEWQSPLIFVLLIAFLRRHRVGSRRRAGADNQATPGNRHAQSQAAQRRSPHRGCGGRGESEVGVRTAPGMHQGDQSSIKATRDGN
jgi:hypothetical protein